MKEKGEPIEFIAFELREGLNHLAEITGETCSEDILTKYSADSASENNSCVSFMQRLAIIKRRKAIYLEQPGQQSVECSDVLEKNLALCTE